MFNSQCFNLCSADYPRPWQLSFQKPATTMMEGIIDLHHDIFTFLVVILIFVSFMLGTILYRYPARFTLRKVRRFPRLKYQHQHGITHNTTLEIVWTIIPTLVLLLIATPSFALIYALDEIVEPELTIRVVGRQWYWTYEFPDALVLQVGGDTGLTEQLVGRVFFGGARAQAEGGANDHVVGWPLALRDPELAASLWLNQKRDLLSFVPSGVNEIGGTLSMRFKSDLEIAFGLLRNVGAADVGSLQVLVPGFSFNSYIVATDDLFPGSFRLLEVDRRLVLPFNTNIRVLVTSYDVIHSWAVPSFGIKVDALPGRLNEYYLNINYLGIFYGQCSEICGVNHGFMPIKVEVTTSEQFRWWFLQTSLLENAPVRFRAFAESLAI